MPEETKHPGGRPLKFESVEDLQIRIAQYFEDCDKEYDTRKYSHGEIVTEDGKQVCSECFARARSKGCMLVSGELKKRRPYTVTGLAVWLDTSRQTLLDYQVRPEFSDAIRGAKQRIEAYAEECLFDPKVPTNGVKFSLSNNHDRWTDKIINTQVNLADLIKAQEAPPAYADPGS